MIEGLRRKYGYLRAHPAYRNAPFATTARLADWRCRSAFGIPGQVRLQREARLWLPPKWRGVAKLLYAFRTAYEPELEYLAARLRPGMVVADVGASYGVYSVVAGLAVGNSGLVLAFEPASEAFRVLERNTALNGLKNVRLFRCALADKIGVGQLAHHPDPSRNALCVANERHGDTETVPITTFDDVVTQQCVRRVDVIKIDAEGSEELILRGALSVLERFKPLVVFEVNETATAEQGLRSDGAWSVLREQGYAFSAISADGSISALATPVQAGNVVAVHPELE